jgi:hypothetical protein
MAVLHRRPWVSLCYTAGSPSADAEVPPAASPL